MITRRAVTEPDVAAAIDAWCGDGALWWQRPIWVRYECARRPDLDDWSYALYNDDTLIAYVLRTRDPRTSRVGLGDGATMLGLVSVADTPDPAPWDAWCVDYDRAAMTREDWTVLGVQSPVMPLEASAPTVWELRRYRPRLRWTRVVNPQVAEIGDVRKSYRQIIRDQRWAVAIRDDADACAIAQRMHQQAAGITRPAASWAIQQEMVAAGDACWAIATDDHDTPVAMAWILCWHDYAYYGSAASAVNDAQKAVQWAVIEHLRTAGVTRYELGWQGEARDRRGQGIEFFKRGFGGVDQVQVLGTIDRATALGAQHEEAACRES